MGIFCKVVSFLLNQSMKLLTFAHRGEALAFLDNLDFKLIEGSLFQTAETLLLITGEGGHDALSNVAMTIGQFPQINSVLNFGVAGNLSAKNFNEVVSIRTIYSHNGADIQFKSVTTSDPQAKVDLLSFEGRVKEEKVKNSLSVFSDLVDREAWAQGLFCQKQKIAFFAYKYASDNADENTQCSLVREDALKASMKLYECYQSLNSNHLTDDFSYPTGFYFTIQQRILFKNYAEKLEILGHALTDSEITILRELEIPPKKKTAELLQLMRSKINPLNEEIQLKLEKAIAPLIKAGARAQFDKELEFPRVDLSYRIQNEEDLLRLRRSLDIFSIKKIKDIFEGEIDV